MSNQLREILRKEIESGKKIIEYMMNRNKTYEQFLERLESETLPTLQSIQSSSFSEILKTLDSQTKVPDYPYDGSLLDKIRFAENIDLRFWNTKTLDKQIIEIEGIKGKKTLKDLPQKLNYYIKKKEIISVKYNNSNFYTFYSSRREWVQNVRVTKNEMTAEFVKGHEPRPELLLNLSEEQRQTKKLVWAGLTP